MAAFTCQFYDRPHILHTAIYCAEGKERHVKRMSNDLGKSSLSNTRRPPENDGMAFTTPDHLLQYLARCHQVLLPYKFA